MNCLELAVALSCLGACSNESSSALDLSATANDAASTDASSSLDATEPPDAAITPDPFPLGHIAWGVNGHTDEGGTYAPQGVISLAQQIADLKNVFGTTPGSVLYRAIGESTHDVATVVTTFQAAGIVPTMLVLGYPSFTNVPDEATAYDTAYATVLADIKAAPTMQIFEIGNEWTLQFKTAPPTGDGSTPDDWRSSKLYPLFRGTAAGGIAAIRDAKPGQAWIIGGSTDGWTYLGLPVALAEDLEAYVVGKAKPRDLGWDYTCLHWYNDAGTTGNRMGAPEAFDGGKNAYALLLASGKPLMVSEFGSSDHEMSSLDVGAGSNLTTLMDDFLAHAQATTTESGIVGASIYQLYQQPGNQTDYFLYTVSGATTTLAPQGQAVKSWLAKHGNPSAP